MRRPLVAGNWKMNGSRVVAEQLTDEISAAVLPGCDVVLCPPVPYLSIVSSRIGAAAVSLGGQDCSEHENGAYTGETAVSMLADIGCRYVIVGHSERRQNFGETDTRVAAKVAAAHSGGLVPILCLGESLAERQAQETEMVVGRQLDAILGLPEIASILPDLVIAYEPVWAIGTGESATPEQAEQVHAWIRERIASHDSGAAERIRLLYGGSVKPDNAAALFAMPDIDGGLIGGASLAADSFIAICRVAG